MTPISRTRFFICRRENEEIDELLHEERKVWSGNSINSPAASGALSFGVGINRNNN
jgi:hypothetical protein